MKPLYFIRSIPIAAAVLLMPGMLQSQGLRISNGASVVVQGDAKLVLNNAGLVNEGSFTAGNSTVLFTGSLPKSNAYISGNKTLFNNVTINRPSANLLLDADASVRGVLTMQMGNLDLNNRRLDLGSTGSIAGETQQSHITGSNGGTITAIAVLNAPQNANPGNVGLIISSAANLGTTIITRGHVQQINEKGERSINRYYDLQPSVNAHAAISVRLLYLEPELANHRAADLVLWSKEHIAGTNWTKTSNVTTMGRFTLGIGDTKAVTKAFLMNSYPNPATDRFTVALYSEAGKRGAISLVDAHGRVLERKPVQYIKGANTIQWDLSKYSAGTYFLVFESIDQPNLKVVKQ